MENRELKLCPFCNGEAVLEHFKSRKGYEATIQCNGECVLYMSTITHDTEEEAIESIKAMTLLKKELKTPVSYHASGKAGIITRIINPVLGGQIAFCVDRYTEASVMEQIDLRSAKSIIENIKKII